MIATSSPFMRRQITSSSPHESRGACAKRGDYSESVSPCALMPGMSGTPISELGSRVGEEVTLKGWLYNRRSSGKIHFLLIRDGTGICQCVASHADIGPAAFAEADHLSQETSLEVTGVVREDKSAPGGRELAVKHFTVHAPSADYPITPKEHGVAFLLDLRHLWVRSARQHAILRVRSEVEAACR